MEARGKSLAALAPSRVDADPRRMQLLETDTNEREPPGEEALRFDAAGGLAAAAREPLAEVAPLARANGAEDAVQGRRRLRVFSRRRSHGPRSAAVGMAGRPASALSQSTWADGVASPGLSDRESAVLPGSDCAAAISDLVGALVTEYVGRGPRAHTYLSENVITIILEDTLTAGERRLVGDGMRELVLSMRMAFQQTMREDLIAGIEQITGRRVRLSANHMNAELAVETLVLDGASGDDTALAAR